MDVRVGECLVIKGGRLHDAQSSVVEEPVEETRPASRNDRVMPLPTYERIQDNGPSPPAYEQSQCTGPTTTSHVHPNLGQRFFQLIHGFHTVDRYPGCFIYNNPKTNTYDSEIGRSTSSSGQGYFFRDGSVWLDDEQVIKDGNELPEGHSGAAQPQQFEILSD
jgi:hypothetical protein